MKPRTKQYWLTRLIPCWQHGESHCYLQENGKHVSRYACKCAIDGDDLCPIDAHRIPWIVEHPDFHDMPAAATCSQVRTLPSSDR